MKSHNAFVVGCIRSGTTWLWRSIATHPEVLGIPESHVMVESTPPDLESAERIRRQPFWTMLKKQSADLTELGVRGNPYVVSQPAAWTSEKLFLEILDTGARASLMAVHEGMEKQPSWEAVARDMMAGLDGIRPIILEKTPNHVYSMERLLGVFPGAKFIGIVRDIRDVWCSIRDLESPWAARHKDPEVMALNWVRTVAAMMQFQERFPDNIQLVRYEDLKVDFRRIMGQIYKLLNLEASSEQLASIDAANQFEAYTGRPAGQASSGNFYRRGLAGAYLDELSPSEAAWFEMRVGKVLTHLGYPCDSVEKASLPVACGTMQA